jgi:hypothetical protein
MKNSSGEGGYKKLFFGGKGVKPYQAAKAKQKAMHTIAFCCPFNNYIVAKT